MSRIHHHTWTKLWTSVTVKLTVKNCMFSVENISHNLYDATFDYISNDLCW